MKTILVFLTTAFAALLPHMITAQPEPGIVNSPQFPAQEILDAGYTEGQMALLREQQTLLNSQLVVHSTGHNQRVVQVNENRKVIDNVPAAHWRGGCAPTSMGMILMYYERLGYDIFPIHRGTSFSLPANVQLIASTRHYDDFYYPQETGEEPQREINYYDDQGNWVASHYVTTRPDKSEVPFYLGEARRFFYDFPREDCVADVLHSSFSIEGVSAGGTLGNAPALYLTDWFKRKVASVTLPQPQTWYIGSEQYNPTQDITTWQAYRREIDAGRPVYLVVDSNGDGTVDHAVAAVGYEVSPDGTKHYACLNTWDQSIKWYEWVHPSANKRFSVLYFITFNPQREEVTAATFNPNYLYRFYRPTTGAYFFTANPEEVAIVENNLRSEWHFEGPIFQIEGAPTRNNSPVYRFYNAKASAHFYTISDEEKAYVIANLTDNYTYEGVAFYGHHAPLHGDKEVHRFYLKQTSSHYFTNSRSEMEYLRNHGDPSYIVYEGVAWYAPAVHSDDKWFRD